VSKRISFPRYWSKRMNRLWVMAHLDPHTGRRSIPHFPREASGVPYSIEVGGDGSKLVEPELTSRKLPSGFWAIGAFVIA
jgi:hypothetical protein